MRRLIFIVEGQSEQEFINKILRPYFLNKFNFSTIETFCIQTSTGHKGGFTKYSHLKDDVLKSLKGSDVIVTTFLDFFRLPNSVPNYQVMLLEQNIDKKIDLLETGLAEDINSPKFIPYIQKHEFEALLFSDNCGFEGLYDNPKIYKATQAIIDAYPNPEDINDNPNTSPSNRLIAILEQNGERYDKITEGNLIAEDIGMSTILSKCQRFRVWIELLVGRITEK